MTSDPPHNPRNHALGRNQRVFYAVFALGLASLSFERTWLRPLSDGTRSTADPDETSFHQNVMDHQLHEVKSSTSEFDENKPMHILFGLSGDHPGFFGEVEVALKSVLLNAPLERNTTIHMMADQKAYDFLDRLFARINITGWQSRSPVSIFTYNTEPYVKQWENEVANLCNKTGVGHKTQHALVKHTVGAWFRLFSYQVLPKDIESVVYMDSDVVITANLEALAHQIDPQYHFQWGELQCSGFMVLTLNKLKSVWDIAASIDLDNVTKTLREGVTDQLVFRAVDDQYSHLTGSLPTEWDLSIANGAWRGQRRFPQVYPNLGMIHYNGGGSGKDPYYVKMWYFNDTSQRGSLGMTNYYVHLPWTWARSFAASHTTDKRRFDLKLFHRVNVTNEPALSMV